MDILGTKTAAKQLDEIVDGLRPELVKLNQTLDRFVTVLEQLAARKELVITLKDKETS